MLRRSILCHGRPPPIESKGQGQAGGLGWVGRGAEVAKSSLLRPCMMHQPCNTPLLFIQQKCEVHSGAACGRVASWCAWGLDELRAGIVLDARHLRVVELLVPCMGSGECAPVVAERAVGAAWGYLMLGGGARSTHLVV